MKTAAIRKTFLAAGMIVIGLGFTGCVEFTAPLCVGDNLEDIPGLEGHKVVNSMDDHYNVKPQSVDINHTGKGTYFNGSIQTCRVGTNTVIQSKTKHGTYSVMAVNSAPTGLSFSTLIVGAEQLKQVGIPFSIVEREQDDNAMAWASRLPAGFVAQTLAPAKTKVMVIDNSDTNSRAMIDKYAVPFALGIMMK